MQISPGADKTHDGGQSRIQLPFCQNAFMAGEKISDSTHHIPLRSVEHKQKETHVTYDTADSRHRLKKDKSGKNTESDKDLFRKSRREARECKRWTDAAATLN